MKIKAWYFAAKDNKLRYGDNREIVVGGTHKVDGKPKLCKNGLHASERLIDALSYAPGPILYQVELSGEFDIGGDKVCATERTYIKRINAVDLLREFARKQALINIEKIKPYTEVYELIVEYLETGDEALRDAAWSAARDAEAAAWDAARDAEAAAWDAARSAWSAARDAAWFAARSAEAAARDSAESAARAAAWFAARSAAAESAARDAANVMLEEMVLNELESKNED